MRIIRTYILKSVPAKAAIKGYTRYPVREGGYFYFADDKNTTLLGTGGDFDGLSIDRDVAMRRDTIFCMQKMGSKVD